MLGAVAQGGICRAGDSFDRFCWGWQLLAQLANERNDPPLLAGPPIYIFHLLECLSSLVEYWIEAPGLRSFDSTVKRRFPLHGV